MPILPAVRDPRLITVRCGGTLSDEHHRLLAEWAALCAEHVLHLFDEEQPCDTRPRDAIDVGRAWVRGEVRLGDARRAAFAANAAARGLADPAKFAALAAGPLRCRYRVWSRLHGYRRFRGLVVAHRHGVFGRCPGSDITSIACAGHPLRPERSALHLEWSGRLIPLQQALAGCSSPLPR